MGAPIGNSNARGAKEWEQSLKRAMARKADGDFRKTLDRIAELVVANAMSGDEKSWREIADRMDGKPAQALAVSGDPDAPLAIEQITRVIVDPKN